MITQAADLGEQPLEPLTVVVLVGSVREPRVGHLIAAWTVRQASARDDLVVDLVDLADVDLPLAGTQPGGGPGSPIADRLAAADAYVVVTPEYNHSFPAALKNAIDWHHRQWMFKPVAFVSYGAGSGGIRAVEQLRLVFAELHVATTRHGVVLTAPWNSISSAGFDPDPATEQAASVTLAELVWWGRALRAARQRQPFAA